jgi:serine/threonine protein kinase
MSKTPEGYWDDLLAMELLLETKKGGLRSNIYKAQWQGKEVVVKSFAPLHPEDLDDIFYVSTCRNEVQILKICSQCPQIIQLLGVLPFGWHKVAYIMEYMNRGSLDKVLADHSQVLEWPKRYHYTIQAARGLAYLHGCEILHRDVKSPNILIDDQGAVKICDFGLSSFKQKQSDIFRGCSPRWIQPERAIKEGTIPKYTEACDVFSFGIVMWEIATLKGPHSEAKTFEDIQKKYLNKEHEPLPKDCPPQYAGVLEPARAFDPKDRPSMKELCQALEQLF